MENSIHFPQPVVASLYNGYARSVFSEAMRLLVSGKYLSAEERGILALVIEKGKLNPDFFRKSFIIYLSEGILMGKDVERTSQIKRQLFFELAVRLLMLGIEDQVAYGSSSPIFSIGLNAAVPSAFGAISRKGDEYVFLQGEEKACMLMRNGACAITPDIDVLEQDSNPFNVNNDHPGEKFVSYDLGGIQKEKWVAQFRAAYALIKEKMPDIYEDIYYFLDAVVPHGCQAGRQLSSSYTKSPGILYLSYTDEDITQAEAVIHEVHHTIFNIISWKYPLYGNDDSLKYYSAYRPDARHIRGCFLGLHAFVAVQNFYRKLAEADDNHKFVEKFLFFYLKNQRVIEVIKRHAKLTGEGELLFRDILTRYSADVPFFARICRVHPSLSSKAEKDTEAHFEEAKKNNKVLLY